MAADVNKHLERAKRFLEKNRVEDAIQAYLTVLDEAPQHQEATQALGDLYARIDQADRAAVYYGMLFDLLVDPKDETKALAIYNRFLRSIPAQQAPERVARYAFLQQRQNRPDEAIEQYNKAGELFVEAGRDEDALFCWERIAQLEPDNLARQIKLAEGAERLGKTSLAARAFLRAGQLATTKGSSSDALNLLGRAQKLAPQERSVALLYAQANLQSGNAVRAMSILEPFAATENDAPFLMTFSEALMGAGQLERASEVLQKLLREKNEGMTQIFDLAERHATAGQDQRAISVLEMLKRRTFADKRQNDFATMMDGFGAKFPHSQSILEFWAGIHDELNRESQYFEVLIKLFDVYLSSGNVKKAAESLERLVEIDPYDFRNQERLERLRGRVDDAYVSRLSSRMLKAGQATGGHAPRTGAPASSIAPANTEEARQIQALEDLIVQTEIFLQYSLQSKALERLQKIASLFPGEEARNARLSSLYQTANWWPPGAQKPKAEAATKSEPAAAAPSAGEPQPGAITGKTGVYSADTLRDLSKISEINQKIFRQQTPRAMLNTAVNEVGTYLKVTRALAVAGAPGRPPEMAAEFCASGIKAAPGAQVVLLLAQMEQAKPDELGGLVVQASEGSILRDLGVETALGVMILDKETQAPTGMLIAAQAERHKWKPNEVYFLQAIGDQMLMSVSHTRLRSLVRRMGVSDERSGLLSRSSYVSCLLTEADRAKSQGTPLSLAVLQIDRGGEILRQQGEPPLERFLEQLARALQPIVRQNDVAVRYTAWSLAFILPDTTLQGAQNLADKLRRAASGLRPPWDSTEITLSAGIVEAVPKADYDSEDIVTDLINRAEFSIEDTRKKGGDSIVALEAPKL
ncbi:MAG TPA: diguanylate cyclase [Candidatus Acidoferrum sp.]|nr:diguanylate cyclase [Candidatus Acidoferrum sp.]